MLLSLKVAWTAAGVAVFCFFGSLTFMAWKVYYSPALTSTVQSVKEGVPDVFAESRNITIAMLDKGRPGKPETMGLIPAVRQVVQDTGKAVQGINTQVAQSATLVNTASQSLRDTSTAVSGTADAATKLLASAKGTTDTLPPLVGDLRANLEHLTPVEDESRQAVEDFDALLKDQAIHRTLTNVADMTDSGDHIMFDFRRVADHETETFLKPVPWYMQPVKKFGDIWDMGAAIARHTP